MQEGEVSLEQIRAFLEASDEVHLKVVTGARCMHGWNGRYESRTGAN